MGSGLCQPVVSNCIVHHMFVGFLKFIIITTTLFYFVSIITLFLSQPSFDSPHHSTRVAEEVRVAVWSLAAGWAAATTAAH